MEIWAGQGRSKDAATPKQHALGAQGVWGGAGSPGTRQGTLGLKTRQLWLNIDALLSTRRQTVYQEGQSQGHAATRLGTGLSFPP